MQCRLGKVPFDSKTQKFFPFVPTQRQLSARARNVVKR